MAKYPIFGIRSCKNVSVVHCMNGWKYKDIWIPLSYIFKDLRREPLKTESIEIHSFLHLQRFTPWTVENIEIYKFLYFIFTTVHGVNRWKYEDIWIPLSCIFNDLCHEPLKTESTENHPYLDLHFYDSRVSMGQPTYDRPPPPPHTPYII